MRGYPLSESLQSVTLIPAWIEPCRKLNGFPVADNTSWGTIVATTGEQPIIGRTFFGRARSTILFWVGLIGSIASILSFIISPFTSGDWRFVFIGVSSTIYIVSLMLICAYVIWDRGNLLAQQAIREASLTSERDLALRKAKYAAVFRQLHSIYHKLRDVLVKLQKNPPKPGDVFDWDFCRAILDIFTEIFRGLKGVQCSVCIKGFHANQEDLKTLCRDSISEVHRGASDGVRPCRVSGNKDFQVVVQGERTYFFCNDLVQAESKGEYFNDNPNWRDRYRSSIVWPIRCRDLASGKHELFGFLCVDSMATGIFDEDPDVQLGACVADMVYTYFNRIDAVNREQLDHGKA